MYWLHANSKDRGPGESWADYSRRSCREVLNKFRDLVSATDFKKEATNWPAIKIDPISILVFVSYFVTEAELAELDANAHRLN